MNLRFFLTIQRLNQERDWIRFQTVPKTEGEFSINEEDIHGSALRSFSPIPNRVMIC